jgi:hypothetical protein
MTLPRSLCRPELSTLSRSMAELVVHRRFATVGILTSSNLLSYGLEKPNETEAYRSIHTYGSRARVYVY